MCMHCEERYHANRKCKNSISYSLLIEPRLEKENDQDNPEAIVTSEDLVGNQLEN